MAYPIRVSKWNVLPVLDVDVDFENLGSAAQVALGRVGFDFRTGLEVGFRERIAVRVGADRGRLTAGAGLRFSVVGVDYGFSNHSDLGNSHRVSLTFSWHQNPFLHL